jgi:antitoxin component YwqK of YwqJK toxin-antitoxin module
MDRLLILSFVASHEGEEIKTISKDTMFVMETESEAMLIKKEVDNSVICSTRTKNNPKVINYVYYPSGVLQMKCEVLGKSKDGYHVEYYPSGNIYIECTYKDNQLHGLETKYKEDTKKYMETNYQNGVIEGKQTIYDDGNLKFINIINNGNLILTQEFYLDGKLKAESQVLNLKLHGEAREYHENQVCKRHIFLKDGLLHGKETCYDLQGKVHSFGNYLNGKKQGKFYFLNTHGKITHVENYLNDVRV